MPLEPLKLQTNIPAEIALKFTTPRQYKSQFGDAPRYMFTLTDGRVIFLSQFQASKIEALNPEPGECLIVCQREKSGNGRKFLEFEVQRAADASEAPAAARVQTMSKPGIGVSANPTSTGHGTLSVPKLNGGSNGTGNGAPASPPAPPAAPHPATHHGTSQAILQTAEVLIDIMATSLKYSRDRYGELVTTDDVRAIVLSAYINASKGGMLL